jgi:hypothetical protein
LGCCALGCCSSNPFLREAFFLAVAAWRFCRFCYFAFYVIQNYVGAEYRFSGLLDFARYMIARKARSDAQGAAPGGLQVTFLGLW